jgi:hypothetical protein
MCASVSVRKHYRVMKVNSFKRGRLRYDPEHTCRDPKDGELCLGRMKPGETLVEVRSDTDVQIVRVSWV